MTELDTGGYYHDRETGLVAAVRRNINNAMCQLTSGQAGGSAIGFVIGIGVAGAVSRLKNGVDE